MANLVRTDSTEFTGPDAGQPPIVLARLPKVGAAPSVPSSVAPASMATAQAAPPPTAPPSTPPSTPLPQAMPQLDLRTEIDQRIKLHVADAPAEQPASVTTHFADRQHAVDPEPTTLRIPSPEPKQTRTTTRQRSTRSHSTTSHSTTSRPKTFSEKLFQLHSQLSPHAGLIVALALIASAGLLYWMIVGPSQVPMPQFDDYSPQFHDEGYGVVTPTDSDSFEFNSQSSDSYMPEFTASLPESREATSSPDQWNEVPLPTPDPPSSTTVTPTTPTLAPPTLQPMPSTTDASPADTQQYPTTGYPRMDFSKVRSVFPSPTQSVAPQPLPAVAKRPTDSLTR